MMKLAHDGELEHSITVSSPITKLLHQIEAHASRIMEAGPQPGSLIYEEANEIESKAGYIALVLAGEEV